MDLALHLPQQLTLHMKSLRRVAGLTQSDLARLLCLSRARVSEIERDPASISVGQLVEVLRVLDVQLVLRANDMPGLGREAYELPPGWQQRRPQGRW
jgi:HTH-type transcriptional regulator/antitoxin HipB